VIPEGDGWSIKQFSREDNRLVPFGVKHLTRS
jgi:hypothetical protein